jgi:DNA polymerase elongation subunit (family B)
MILHVNGYFTHWSKKADTLVLNCVDRDRKLYRFTVVDECLRPRFYIPASEMETMKQVQSIMGDRILKVEPGNVPDRFGKPVACIYTRFKDDVPEARAFFKVHYQASIEWHKMAMIALGLWEWIDVDMAKVRYGSCPVEALKPAADPGWEWEGRTCWLDTEWDAGGLDHVPRPKDAMNSKCIVIACINDVTEQGMIFSMRKKEEPVIETDVETRLGTRIPPKIKVIKRTFVDEATMLRSFIEWFSKQGFDTIAGHNICGGWIVTNHGRSWRNGFDLPLLHERCKLLGVADNHLSPVGSVRERIEGDRYELVVKGVLLFDWLYAWKFSQYGKYQERTVVINGKPKKIRLKGNGLDELGKFYFGRGKARGKEELAMFYGGVDVDISRMPVWTLHSLFPEVADHYCLQDAILSWGLDKRHNLKHDILSVAYLVGAPPEDAMLASRYHKVYTYRLLKDKMVLESDLLSMAHPDEETDEDEVDEKFGAYVPEAVRGIHDNVLDLDFVGMYPSIYKTTNAGVDTLIEPRQWSIKEGVPAIEDEGGRCYLLSDLIFAPGGAIFRKRPDSVDRFIFTTLGKERSLAKKNRDTYTFESPPWTRWEGFQKRVKVAMNSRFGTAILPIFNTATLTGQFLLKSVISFLGEERIVGGDTDGLHVKLAGSTREELVQDAKKIVEAVNAFIDKLVREEFGVDQNFLVVEGATIADRVLYHAKKMYMERIVWEKGKWLAEPRYEYKGFKPRRSDSSEAMDLLFDGVRDIVFASAGVAQAKTAVEKYLREFHVGFKKMGPKEMAIPKSLSKYSDQYGNTFESRAANFTRIYFKKEYLPGETFYVLSLADYPNKIGGKPVLPEHVTPKAALAFDDDTMHFLEKVTVDVPDMERATVAAIDAFSEFLGINYNKVVSISGGLFR